MDNNRLKPERGEWPRLRGRSPRSAYNESATYTSIKSDSII